MEENPKEKVNLIISCMDRRLNEAIEARAENTLANSGKRTIVLRNAGGDVDNLHDSITELLSKYDVEEARVTVHNDCGAMKNIAQIKHNVQSSDDTHRKQTAEKYTNTDAEGLCKENLTVQLNSLQKIVSQISPDTKVIVDSLDVLHVPLDNSKEKKAAIILDSAERSHTNYSELAGIIGTSISNAYFIQCTAKDNLIPDIGLLPKALGINDITIFSTEKTNSRASALFEDINKQKFASPSLHVTLVELRVAQPAEQHGVKVKHRSL